MALTPEELAEISRRNGSRSRGPLTDESKRKVRFNGLREGYYAKLAPIPGIPAGMYDDIRNDWVSYYNPQSPAAFDLIDVCVRSKINRDRANLAQDEVIAGNMEEALEELERGRQELVDEQLERLDTEPARAAHELRRLGLGCLTLVQKFEEIRHLATVVGFLHPPELHRALHLMGSSHELETLHNVVNSYMLMIYNLCAQPRDPAVVGQIATLARRDFRPPLLRDKELEFANLTPELARAGLLRVLDSVVADLRCRAQELKNGKDRIEEGRLVGPCMLILGEEANSYFRHKADTRSDFHRGLRDLYATLDRDSAAGADDRDDSQEDQGVPAQPAAETGTQTEPEKSDRGDSNGSAGSAGIPAAEVGTQTEPEKSDRGDSNGSAGSAGIPAAEVGTQTEPEKSDRGDSNGSAGSAGIPAGAGASRHEP